MGQLRSVDRLGTPLRVLTRLAGHAIFRGLQVLGCLALLGVAFLLTLERTGWLEREVERQLATTLAAGFGVVEVGEVDLDLPRGTVALRDVALGAVESEIEIRALEGHLVWTPGQGLALSRVDVLGATVRVSARLLAALQRLAEREPRGKLTVPSVVARSVVVSLETDSWGDLPIGSVDVSLVPEGDSLRVSGRIAPGAAGSESVVSSREQSVGFAYLDGRLTEGRKLEVRAAGTRVAALGRVSPAAGARSTPCVSSSLRASSTSDVLGRYIIGEDVFPEIEARYSLTEAGLYLPWVSNPDLRRRGGRRRSRDKSSSSGAANASCGSAPRGVERLGRASNGTRCPWSFGDARGSTRPTATWARRGSRRATCSWSTRPSSSSDARA